MYTILLVSQRAKDILEVRDFKWGKALPGEALRELMAQLFYSSVSHTFFQVEDHTCRDVSSMLLLGLILTHFQLAQSLMHAALQLLLHR